MNTNHLKGENINSRCPDARHLVGQGQGGREDGGGDEKSFINLNKTSDSTNYGRPPARHLKRARATDRQQNCPILS